MTWIPFLTVLLLLFTTEGSVLLGPLAPWRSNEDDLFFEDNDLSLYQSFSEIKAFYSLSDTETYYIKLLNSVSLYGNWHNTGTITRQADYFDEVKGLSQTDKINSRDANPKSWNIFLSILDGGYLTSKLFSLSLQHSDTSFYFNEGNAYNFI